jgi:hypothetical protein
MKFRTKKLGSKIQEIQIEGTKLLVESEKIISSQDLEKKLEEELLPTTYADTFESPFGFDNEEDI